MLRSLSLSLLLIAGACGGSDKPTSSTTPTHETPTDQTATDQGAPCEAPTEGPMTDDQCTCQGGTVHGDPGDGSAHCEATERELGKVATGIEGGVCCAPADPAAP
jgi:hypothetical protein